VTDALAQLAAHQAALRAGAGALIGYPIEHFLVFANARTFPDQVPPPRLLLPQMIQTQIGYDPVDPRIEGRLETEAVQVDVGSQERLLIDVLTIIFSR